jgi:uncharacterized protein YeaO (DUF488 family)
MIMRTIQLKRVYELPAPEDGFRILVERLWPWGPSRERAKLDLWVKDAGASNRLRMRFGHDPAKWEEFCRKYREESRSQHAIIRQLMDAIRTHGTVTFLFAARDGSHNNAVALKEFLESELAGNFR